MPSVLMLIATTERRGAEQFAVDLAPRLSGRVTLRALAPTTTGAPLPVEPLGPSRFAPSTLRALRAEARRHDVMICHGGPTLLPGAVVATSLGMPYVYRSVGDPAVWTNVPLVRWRLSRPLKGAAAVVALFPDARTTLVRHHGLDPDRVVVLSNAVDPARISANEADGAALRQELDVGSVGVRRWVGFVGALSEEKRVHLAVEAVATRSDWGLLIAGDGPEERWLKSLADYAAPERIKFLGRRDDMASAYGAMDALVLTSATEGVPAVAIEAAMRGVPVIATNVGGVGEMMAGGVPGVLVDDATVDALVAALASVLDGGRTSTKPSDPTTALLARYGIDEAGAAWDRLIASVTGT